MINNEKDVWITTFNLRQKEQFESLVGEEVHKYGVWLNELEEPNKTEEVRALAFKQHTLLIEKPTLAPANHDGLRVEDVIASLMEYIFFDHLQGSTFKDTLYNDPVLMIRLLKEGVRVTATAKKWRWLHEPVKVTERHIVPIEFDESYGLNY